MLKDSDGKLSFARIFTGIILTAWLLWVSYIVFTTKLFPSNTWEISTLVTALYGMNKVSAAIAGNPIIKLDDTKK